MHDTPPATRGRGHAVAGSARATTVSWTRRISSHGSSADGGVRTDRAWIVPFEDAHSAEAAVLRVDDVGPNPPDVVGHLLVTDAHRAHDGLSEVAV